MISEFYAKSYCCEDISKIENFEQANADKTQMWHCHHRLETDEDGNTLYTKKQLIAMNMYLHRPASELIFVTPSMHKKIHSAAKKMNAKLTFEQRSKGGKIAAAKLTFEQRSKINKGKKWWNNGAINRRAKECPGDGWLRGKMRRRST